LNFDSIQVTVAVPVTALPERSGPGGPRRERRNVPGAAPR
jgi:small subunit ribosomal protein S17e